MSSVLAESGTSPAQQLGKSWCHESQQTPALVLQGVGQSKASGSMAFTSFAGSQELWPAWIECVSLEEGEMRSGKLDFKKLLK